MTGGDDAATQYFKQATYAPLKVKFTPIVAAATKKVKLSETYDAVAKKAVALGVLKPEDATLQSHVTDKALEGTRHSQRSTGPGQQTVEKGLRSLAPNRPHRPCPHRMRLSTMASPFRPLRRHPCEWISPTNIKPTN